MRFSRTNSGIVAIQDEPLEQLLAYRQFGVGTNESGGMLLGRLIIGSNDVIIDKVSLPDPSDRRGRFSFVRSKNPAQKIVNSLWVRSKGTCVYLGEWHTHPENNPHPSSTIDVPSWKEIAVRAKYEQDFLFFAIVGLKEIRLWEINKLTGEIVSLKCLDYADA